MASSKRKVRRECIACLADQPDRYGIPDPCLGRLPGVQNACCGHGSAIHCYVQLPGGQTSRGEAAREQQISLGGDPAPLTRTDPATWRTKR